METILVTCYTEPDLDGFACAIAYAELLGKTGQQAVPKFFGLPNVEARFLMQKFNLPYPPEVQAEGFTKVILVDASELRDLDHIIKPENVIEVIDHRKVNDAALFTNAKVQIEKVGSAATLIAEKFRSAKIDISKESSILLYGAIISNTLNFQAGVTTDRDRAMAAWLNQNLGFGTDFIEDMFRAKSDLAGDALAARINGDFAWFLIGGRKIGVGQLEIVGARELVEVRKDEIFAILAGIKAKLALDKIFLSIIDLTQGFNVFISADVEVQELLHDVLDAEFNENIAFRKGFIMRKEIVPLLKQKLEGSVL